MENSPLSNELKESCEDAGQEKCENLGNDGSNSLLCALTEYVWDESDGEYSERKVAEFTRWLASKDLPYVLSGSDADVTAKIMLTSNEDLFCETREVNDQKTWAKLAFKLREVLPILIACNDDVNYVNDNDQTFLHVFIENCLKDTDQFSQDQVFKLSNLMYYLKVRKTSFCVKDKHGKTAVHYAATCKSREILQTIIYSLTSTEASPDFVNTVRHILMKDCAEKSTSDEAAYVDLIITLVSESAADVNAKNEKGVMLVHLAAERYDLAVLKFLDTKRANFVARTNNDETPLHFMFKSTRKSTEASKIIEILDFLASKGCDLEAYDKNGFTALHYAAEFQSARIIDRLIELGISVDPRSQELLLTPLHLAAKSDRLDNMKALLEAGADVNAGSLDDSTPLFVSVMLGSYESMKFLMDQGADLHRRENIAGFTLLHFAAYDAQQVHSRKLDEFINEGFDINDPAFCGISPLQLAAVRENFDHVKMLIERGADVNYRRDRFELTALHLATTHLGIVKILLENGADVDCRGGADQMTPLHMLLATNFKWHLGKHPDVESYEKPSYLFKYWPIVRPASAWSCDRLVAVLLEHEADVNARDAAGMTPLHYAALRCKTGVMKMLLEAGARTNVQDKNGRVPIHGFLEKDGSVEGLKLLLAYGADINDDDTSQMIMNCKEELKSAAVEHAIKRKLIGLYCAKVYEPLIDQSAFANFHEQCSEEAVNLVNYCDDAGFSIYEFLRMNAKFQYHALKKIEDTRENLRELFPVYESLIVGVCRESANRKPLLESARIFWKDTFNTLIPTVCVEIILSYLGNRYLEVFIARANDVEKIINKEELKGVIVGRK